MIDYLADSKRMQITTPVDSLIHKADRPMSAETFEAECTCEPMPMRIYHGLPVIAAYDCTSCETHRMKVSA